MIKVAELYCISICLLQYLFNGIWWLTEFWLRHVWQDFPYFCIRKGISANITFIRTILLEKLNSQLKNLSIEPYLEPSEEAILRFSDFLIEDVYGNVLY